MNILLVALGGAIGAVSRYEVVNLFNKKTSFPLSTFTVNLIGSALLGICFAYLLKTDTLYIFFAVGFLGAFTTFSTFSVESMKLIQKQKWAILLTYLLTTLAGSILAFSVFYFLL
ncbi:fluoride efflux transporter CrcB [Filobacillus milosensis]|uniref:Fluoride-specific ion channel FluC n=1 Tax=Filobacillus milosensis TaxID=94137 RepID=A0A4Y8IGN0_9BACI|nr:fluoride efflux transporter CrcB [Filobacillus milosensis]TFB14274.1 fluoride efflux transporter CrcB [Filobacillus milosensis]